MFSEAPLGQQGLLQLAFDTAPIVCQPLSFWSEHKDLQGFLAYVLSQLGISPFYNRGGSVSGKWHLETAVWSLGVVTTPEFVSRPWQGPELICFLQFQFRTSFPPVRLTDLTSAEIPSSEGHQSQPLVCFIHPQHTTVCEKNTAPATTNMITEIKLFITFCLCFIIRESHHEYTHY